MNFIRQLHFVIDYTHGFATLSAVSLPLLKAKIDPDIPEPNAPFSIAVFD
jgi:hypothetical protein